MNKIKITLLALLLIISCSFVSAIEIEDTSSSGSNSEIAVLRQDVSTKFESINMKLDSFANKSDIESLLVAHLKKTQELNNALITSLILNACFLILATLGLGYGVYFYFKAKGRL